MSRTTDKDFGTPKVISDKHVTLRIDGKSITVPEGTSVMRAAAELDINIPSLCATDRVKAFGSCRLCLVEINGRKGMPASCHTLVEDGMDVSTQTDKVNKLRKHIMELYISDLPFNAVTCSDNGDSELYNVAKDLEITKSRYGSDGQNHLNAEKDESTPYFTFDPSQCIVCSRCVRACEDVQGTFALTVSGRGFDSKITASDNKSFMDSECVSCGECVDVCPTGALMEKTTLEQGIGNREIEKRTKVTIVFCIRYAINAIK